MFTLDFSSFFKFNAVSTKIEIYRYILYTVHVAEMMNEVYNFKQNLMLMHSAFFLNI